MKQKRREFAQEKGAKKKCRWVVLGLLFVAETEERDHFTTDFVFPIKQTHSLAARPDHDDTRKEKLQTHG